MQYYIDIHDENGKDVYLREIDDFALESLETIIRNEREIRDEIKKRKIIMGVR